MKYKIKDFCTIINGSTPSTEHSEYWNGNIAWITPKDLAGYSRRYISQGERFITEKGYNSCSTTIVPKDTILLTSRAPIGYLAIAEKDICTNQGFKSIICNKSQLVPLYLFYWLENNIDFLKSISNGATFKELSKEALENVEIDLPNIVFQQHIVDTIGSVDDLIEKLQKKIDNLINFSLQLFNHYETNQEGKFMDVFKCFNGGTFKSKDYINNSKYKLITIKNIDDNGFNSDKTSFLQENVLDKKYLLKPGDILLTMTGNIGRVGIVDDKNCYLNQRVLKITANSKLYLFSYLTKYKKEIIQLGKGTAQQNLSLQDLYELKVNNSKEEITRYSEFDYIFDLMLNYKFQIRKLKTEKDLLLKKYFG
jgi:type I restriction enzyme S subunit